MTYSNDRLFPLFTNTPQPIPREDFPEDIALFPGVLMTFVPFYCLCTS